MISLNELIEVFSFSEAASVNKAASSLIIVLVLWFIRFLILKIVDHYTHNQNIKYSWRKGTLFAIILIAAILIIWLWLENLQPILTFFGIIAAALTITLKEVLLNLAGVLFILWRNIFAVGDRIEVDTHKGDVVGIGLFYFTMLEIGNWVDAEQSTGRIIKVPNSRVLTQPVFNYSRSFPYIWDEISIGLSVDSNWKKARQIIENIAISETEDFSQKAREYVKQSEDELIHFQHFSPKVYLSLANRSPASILLTLRYLCEPRKRRDKEDSLWEAILDKFAIEPDITISNT
ncbi:mechanosensitive ion channel family protein [bacterium]|nr:mechanosensitive ion channel family protein [bacterium]